ncbi:hypothetical protein NDU88_009561 [Pleurodeles waltl]|uniref:Uncharacterized protein n=1 Tax=Pleurodeles waltl TaxID=8319 RepID=A0AAV7PVK9_PLEWA|nr:hypothetical protein NDU88_009561 [Pleurodeles waltl]
MEIFGDLRYEYVDRNIRTEDDKDIEPALVIRKKVRAALDVVMTSSVSICSCAPESFKHQLWHSCCLAGNRRQSYEEVGLWRRSLMRMRFENEETCLDQSCQGLAGTTLSCMKCDKPTMEIFGDLRYEYVDRNIRTEDDKDIEPALVIRKKVRAALDVVMTSSVSICSCAPESFKHQLWHSCCLAGNRRQSYEEVG